MYIFDTHAHYNDTQFDIDRDVLLTQMQTEGVETIVTIGTNVQDSAQAVQLAKQYPGYIYATCGIHPEELPETKQELDDMLQQIEEMAKQTEVVAIGEIGLDYYWKNDNKELQQYAFIKQIEIANRLHLPVSIHTRESIDDTIAILRKYPVEKQGILHCCPFNRELVKQGLAAGYYIAFGGVTTFKNAKHAEEIVQMVPSDRMVIETDAPYLAPEPYRGKRNDSRNLRYVAEKLSTFRGETVDNILETTYQNACRVYQIDTKKGS